MPFKKHTPEEIIGKLREAEIVLAQGGTTADACRRLSISEQRYARSQGDLGRAVFTPTVSLASSTNMALRVIFHQSYVGTSRVG